MSLSIYVRLKLKNTILTRPTSLCERLKTYIFSSGRLACVADPLNIVMVSLDDVWAGCNAGYEYVYQ